MLREADFKGLHRSFKKYERIVAGPFVTPEEVDDLVVSLIEDITRDRERRDQYYTKLRKEQCMGDFLRRHLAELLWEEQKKQEGEYC